MTEVLFSFLDLGIMYLELLLGIILYAVIKSYLDRKWKKRG